MITTPEENLEYVTIEQWFSKDFFESNLWYYWSAMLAFQPYESLVEMRRYAIRFMHQLHLIKSLKQILRTKYDQYHGLILPLQKYLTDRGVNFVSDTTVTDMDMDIQGKLKAVTALRMEKGGKEYVQAVGKEDMVFFTNGSMTQNSTRGSMTEAPVMNRDIEHRGCFTLWEKLAAKSEDFGHPENFISVTITITDYPQLFQYIEEKTGNQTGTGGGCYIYSFSVVHDLQRRASAYGSGAARECANTVDLRLAYKKSR